MYLQVKTITCDIFAGIYLVPPLKKLVTPVNPLIFQIVAPGDVPSFPNRRPEGIIVIRHGETEIRISPPPLSLAINIPPPLQCAVSPKSFFYLSPESDSAKKG